MSDRAFARAPSPLATAFALTVTAVRFVLTIGVLAVGLWAALPLIFRQETPVVAPTVAVVGSLPPAVASALTSVDRALAQAQQSGKAVPLTVSLSEQDLTRAAAAYFPQTYVGVTVSAPNVRVTGGQLLLTAAARSLLVSGPLVAAATPYASDGKLLVRLDQATISGFAVPDLLRSQLQQQLQSAIDGQVPARLQVTSVTAAQGTLAVSGTALP